MRPISDAEVEKRIRAWADVTMLAIELKLSMLRQRHPELSENELREFMRREHSAMKDKY